MEAIRLDCDDRGFELVEVASGYRFQVKQDISEWVAKLWEEKPPRYTRALLETLALIAYRQPITRGDIEEIRGVAVSSNITRTLLDREWIRVVGHRDVPGRPAMFATTKQFLDYFNLKSLEQLPPLSEIKELDKQEEKLDLNAELANQRVIDLPEDPVDENSLELSEEEQAEMLAEEEAIELAKKPLDEILSQDPARQQEQLQEGEDGEDEDGDETVGDDEAGGEEAGGEEESSADSRQQAQDDELLQGDQDSITESGVAEPEDAAQAQPAAESGESGLAASEEQLQEDSASEFEAEAGLSEDGEVPDDSAQAIDFSIADAEEGSQAADETADESETIRDEHEAEDELPPADVEHNSKHSGGT